MVLFTDHAEVFDTATGQSVQSFAEGQMAEDGALTSDGKAAATTSDTQVRWHNEQNHRHGLHAPMRVRRHGVAPSAH